PRPPPETRLPLLLGGYRWPRDPAEPTAAGVWGPPDLVSSWDAEGCGVGGLVGGMGAGVGVRARGFLRPSRLDPLHERGHRPDPEHRRDPRWRQPHLRRARHAGTGSALVGLEAPGQAEAGPGLVAG